MNETTLALFRTRYVLQWVTTVQAGDALIIDPWYNNSECYVHQARVYEAAFPLPSDESPVETTEEQAALHATAGMPDENPVRQDACPERSSSR